MVTLCTTSLISKTPALSRKMLGLCMIIRLNYDYFPQQQDFFNVDSGYLQYTQVFNGYQIKFVLQRVNTIE